MSDIVHGIWQGRSLEEAARGLSAFSLMLCLAGTIVGASMYMLGTALGNSLRDKAQRLMFCSFVGALAMGVTSGRANLEPDFAGVPSDAAVQAAGSILGALGLLLALSGILIGVGLWGVGELAGRDSWARKGLATILSSIYCAVIIGAAEMVVNYLYSLGSLA